MEASVFEGVEVSSRDMPMDEQLARRARRRFRILLDGGSLALFAIFLVRLLPVLLEINPTDSTWQGDFVDAVVNQGLIAYLGFVMLHVASFIQPSNDRLRRRLRFVRRLAVLAVVGYVLTVGLQLSSTIGEFTSAQSNKAKYLDQGARLSEIRESLQGASSVQDLNVRLQSLLQPGLTAEQLNQPLPQLRKSLLKQNDLDQQRLNNLITKNLEDVNSFGSVISRIGSALGWAFAFAAGAVPWGSHSTLVERTRRR